jgi:hypothetical protein
MRARERPAISRTVMIALVAVLAIAGAAGVFILGSGGSNSSSVSVDVQIIEDDPVLQHQHFYPDNFTVRLGQNVNLAVRNGDDEPRTFTINDFNVNETMGPGTTGRVSFLANRTGTFTFFSPPSVPSPVSQGRPGQYIQGNVIVTP